MSGPLVWRALAAGAGFNVAISLLMSFGSGFLFGLVGASWFALLAFVLRVVSALADIGSGAIAGYIANRDGPLHGALASLIASLLMLPISFVRMWVASADVFSALGAAYWIDFGLWTAVGLVLAAIAGFLVVELRRARGA
ncbi:MAG: hypothetical protein HYV17_03925 [Xanthomonadales bacterium]|nr:hypothetical protein [Xanthomonadales bacterium]